MTKDICVCGKPAGGVHTGPGCWGYAKRLSALRRAEATVEILRARGLATSD